MLLLNLIRSQEQKWELSQTFTEGAGSELKYTVLFISALLQHFVNASLILFKQIKYSCLVTCGFFCFGGGVLWFCVVLVFGVFLFLVSFGVFFFVRIHPNVFILPPSDLLILMLKREAGKNSPELLSCSVKKRQTNTFLCR